MAEFGQHLMVCKQLDKRESAISDSIACSGERDDFEEQRDVTLGAIIFDDWRIWVI